MLAPSFQAIVIEFTKTHRFVWIYGRKHAPVFSMFPIKYIYIHKSCVYAPVQYQSILVWLC